MIRLRRLLVVLIFAATCPIVGITVTAGSASASTLPCKSYAYACTPGYTGANARATWAWSYYGAWRGGSAWTSTGYHNCTLYVAWRLAQSGMEDPGRSWGNAVDWAKSIGGGNHTPAVGAIAWWGAEMGGGDGHVAYVESVSGGNVLVRADNYSTTRGFTTARWLPANAVDLFLHPHEVAPPAQPRLPTQPRNPRITSVSVTSAALSWAEASTDVDSFRSQYKIGRGFWTAGPTVAANQTSMTISGLKPGTRYTFQVGAENTVGTHWSAYFYGTTAKASAPPPSSPPPLPPTTYHAGRRVSIDTHATGGVSGHTGPSNSYATGPTHARNTAIWIVCYVNGQSITGPYGTTTIWDLSDDGYYYTDAWIYTGSNYPVVPRCAPRTVSIDSHATGGVSGHRGPGNSYATGPTHARNTQIAIYCYVNGQSITGPYGTTTIWDLSDDGYYYTDAWIYTGSNYPVVPHC